MATIFTTGHAQKVTAQIACEYVINEPHAGWLNSDRLAVLDVAIGAGVGDLYLDGVAEQIQLEAMRADGVFGA